MPTIYLHQTNRAKKSSGRFGCQFPDNMSVVEEAVNRRPVEPRLVTAPLSQLTERNGIVSISPLESVEPRHCRVIKEENAVDVIFSAPSVPAGHGDEPGCHKYTTRGGNLFWLWLR